MEQVRTAKPEDAAAIAAIYAPYVVETAISFEERAPSTAEMAGRIAALSERFPFLVYEEDGEALGYAYASAHAERAAYRWSVDVAIYTTGKAQRRGIGRSLYTTLFETLVRQGFHAAFAGIALPNPASVGLHEAMGFVHVGDYEEVGFKHGAWHDVGWWRRPLAMGPPMGEPIPFPALR